MMPKQNTSQNLLIALLCLALSVLAGCGRKGPLYIPEQRYPQKESAPETPKPEIPKEAPNPENTN